MESKTFRGVWWPEGQPEKQVAGELEYIPTSLSRLDLLGDFTDSLGGSSETVSFDKILGVTDEGEPMTLVKCDRDNRSRKSSAQASFTSSVYVVQLIISGHHFKYHNPAFDSLHVAYYGAEWWAQKSSPVPGMDLSNSPTVTAGDTFYISLEIPDKDSAWVNQTKISISTRGSTSFDKFRSGEISAVNRFSIKPKRTQVPAEEYVEHITKLRDFISLGLGGPALPKSIHGSVRKSNGEKVNVEIFMGIQTSPQTDFGHPLRYLFDLSLVDFEKSLPLWYEKYSKFKDTFNLYFGALYNDEMYPQNQFIGLCHALEAYHRQKIGRKYVSQTVFNDLYDDLIDLLKRDPADAYSGLVGESNLRARYSLPSDFVSSLENGKIKYANELSLRRRIEEITDQREDAIKDLPYTIYDREDLVANTRNYFSHYTDELRMKAARGGELQELMWGVQQLVEACLLSEIGIDDQVTNERLKRRYENRWVN